MAGAGGEERGHHCVGGWHPAGSCGNETVYLVRDALTGRVLVAENVTSSETAVMKALLAPVVALEACVLGTISDAQESERLSVEQLWPDVPHQVCQFHVLRDAIKPAYEADRKVKTAMRKQLQRQHQGCAQAAETEGRPGDDGRSGAAGCAG